MKNAIILHGCPEKQFYYDPKLPSESNAHWLPWLQKELLIRDIAAATPEIPKSYDPKWEAWVREVERFDIGPETLLVGHSCGGGFWVRYLSDRPELSVGQIILVAPWLDPDQTIDPSFFDFTTDPSLGNRAKKLIIFHSTDDSESIWQSVQRLRRELPGHAYREFHDKGHFTYDNLGGAAFPELLDECLAQ